MLDSRQGFKAGFLLKCAEAGLSEGEIAALLDHVLSKDAALSDLITTPYNMGMNAISNLTHYGGIAGGAALLAAPIGVGAGVGYGAAKLTDLDDEDPSETKLREQINEYLRLAEQARLNRAMRDGQQQRPRSGRPVV